ncbi:hypothetical protein AK830_g1839 [Neonectria ditissima]|uniref:BTB domain-containing protein n=1 Tax=Neonectria ditissima TaxID=78410 RepID=A0A0P7BTF9_9HYPO|nr:hypothetical protein AK830_g1839 [Neonectria ditissima]
MAQQGESSDAAVIGQSFVDAMYTSSTHPHVVVLESTYRGDIDGPGDRPPNAAEDLWLSTVDGRYSSHPIPIRVGTLHNMQTFHVHKDILTKAHWFQKALSGGFKEADEQLIDLPEEDPAIFHFLVAFLYEERFDPIRAAASVLEPLLDKGKGVSIEPDPAEDAGSGSSSSSSSSSYNSNSSGSAWQRRRRTRGVANSNDGGHEKRPGIHRPGCQCPLCITRQDASRCWQCGARRLRNNNHNQRRPTGLLTPGRRPGIHVDVTRPLAANDAPPRIEGEDMQTWLLAYELNLDVYICANRYLMDDFRNAVMRSCIDMLETAGTDAAHPRVLRLCRKLFAGVPETDPLLKMVLARVGFLQPMLWKRAPEETSEFLVENPGLAAAILRETVMRHEATSQRPDLPSMEGA